MGDDWGDDGWDEPKPAKKEPAKKPEVKKAEPAKKPAKPKDEDEDGGEDGGDEGGGKGGGGGDEWGDDDWGGQPPAEQQADEGSSIAIEIQNKYCLAEEKLKPAPKKALEAFQEVVDMAKAHGFDNLDDESHSTVFKSLCHLVSLRFQLKKYSEVVDAYKTLLGYFKYVSQNDSDTAVEKILSDTNVPGPETAKLREELYAITADTLSNMRDKGNMLFTVQMRQCNELVQKERYKEAHKLLDKVHERCKVDGKDDAKNKGSELIEIYALELRIASKLRNTLKLRELYEKTKGLTAAVKNPKSQSIIKECWGKMFGDEGQWSKAYSEFFAAVTFYTDAGDPHGAKQCLKYLVMANMLAKQAHNPFSAKELRVYQNDPEITPFVNLRTAYEKRDVEGFSACLAEFEVKADDYIKSHMQSTVEEFHRLTLLKILKSYRRIRIDELAAKLKITTERTEYTLIQLILDGVLGGKIDQVNGILDLTQSAGGGAQRYLAMEQWSSTLESLSKSTPQPQASRGGRFALQMMMM